VVGVPRYGATFRLDRLAADRLLQRSCAGSPVPARPAPPATYERPRARATAHKARAAGGQRRDPLRTCPFVLAQENTDLIRGMNHTFDHAVIARHAARRLPASARPTDAAAWSSTPSARLRPASRDPPPTRLPAGLCLRGAHVTL
jgi:hypothetical protein